MRNTQQDKTLVFFQNAPQVSSDRNVPENVTKRARIAIMWMVCVTEDVIPAGRETTAKKVIFIFYLCFCIAGDILTLTYLMVITSELKVLLNGVNNSIFFYI